MGFLLAPFVQLIMATISGNESFRFLYGASAAILIVCTIVAFFVAMKKSNQVAEEVTA